MRALLVASVSLIACGGQPAATVPSAPPASGGAEVAVPAPAPAAGAQAQPTTETLTRDTPKQTAAGNGFVAPAGWSFTQRGPATFLETPEAGSFVVFVDVPAAKDADAAVAAAWAIYKPDASWPLKSKTAAADKDGWTARTSYDYQTSPNEQRWVGVNVMRANGVWSVVILDMAQAVAEKRGSQLGKVFDKLLPKGGERESFAGKRAHPLDAPRIAALGKFVETAMAAAGVPGVSVGLIENGKVVFSGGFGVRQLGKPAKPDGDTRYMIASNTKGLATLMLAKLVDAKKLTWETPAKSLLSSFKLGDADTTSKVLVKHLICACTGLPRQDMEWLLEFKGVTPDGLMKSLGTMQPTSKFGELFQYSNPLAAAAGFIGGHVAFPKLEIGAAYDKAMQTLVFDPLGMKATTHDFAKGQRGNAAIAHAPDIDGKPALAITKINWSIVPVRPAGGAWSSVNDMLKYVQMELAEGKLADGSQYIAKDTLLARRAPQIATGADSSYGMGLSVDTTYGVTVVHHGGDMIGFHSDMMWLPEHGVGAVILTNGDPGWLVRSQFRRKLLEVLFDGRAEADAAVAAQAKTFYEQIAAERKLYTVPADPAEVSKLAKKYTSAALGSIVVSKKGAATVFDFGEFASEVASRKNPDGTVSFLTTVPGFSGLELVVGAGPTKTLVLRDPQHEYVFTAK